MRIEFVNPRSTVPLRMDKNYVYQSPLIRCLSQTQFGLQIISPTPTFSPAYLAIFVAREVWNYDIKEGRIHETNYFHKLTRQHSQKKTAGIVQSYRT